MQKKMERRRVFHKGINIKEKRGRAYLHQVSLLLPSSTYIKFLFFFFFFLFTSYSASLYSRAALAATKKRWEGGKRENKGALDREACGTSGTFLARILPRICVEWGRGWPPFIELWGEFS